MLRPLLLSVLILTGFTQFAVAADNYTRHQRAGNPLCISRLAEWTYDGGYVGYYVGGGAKKGKGDVRCAHEGTWGMDYNTVVPMFRNGVILNWWHGRKYQDGNGTYEPDHTNRPFKSFLKDRGFDVGH